MDAANNTPKVVLIPSHDDIICGSGGKVSTHPGNKLFRAIVAAHYYEYSIATSKKEKMRTTQKVMDALGLAPFGPARLLKKDPIFERYYVAGRRAARDKVSHCLREMKIANARMCRQREHEGRCRVANKAQAGKTEKDWEHPHTISVINNGLLEPAAPATMISTINAKHGGCTIGLEFTITQLLGNLPQGAVPPRNVTEHNLLEVASLSWRSSSFEADDRNISIEHLPSPIGHSRGALMPSAASMLPQVIPAGGTRVTSDLYSPNLESDAFFDHLITSLSDPTENTMVQQQEKLSEDVKMLRFQNWNIELLPLPQEQQQRSITNKNRTASGACIDDQNYFLRVAAMLENDL